MGVKYGLADGRLTHDIYVSTWPGRTVGKALHLAKTQHSVGKETALLFAASSG